MRMRMLHDSLRLLLVVVVVVGVVLVSSSSSLYVVAVSASAPPRPLSSDTSAIGAAATTTAAVDFIPYGLTTEYTTNPLGIQSSAPRFAWQLKATNPSAYNISQWAYMIKCTTAGVTIWNSDRVVTNQSVYIIYQGNPLRSGQRVEWQVTVWDAQGATATSTESAWFEMGLLTASDWRGNWIARNEVYPPPHEAAMYQDAPCPMLRHTFNLLTTRPIQSARLYISGLGYYEVSLNGERVGDRRMEPAQTTYGKRVFYSTYDVTSMLRGGKQAIGVMLANGWFNPLPLRMWATFNLRDNLDIGLPRVIVQLNVRYHDGTNQSIVSDDTWRTGSGPIIRNTLYLGEHYDARRETPGWNTPSFDDSTWPRAIIVGPPKTNFNQIGGWNVTVDQTSLEAQLIPPARYEPVTLPAKLISTSPLLLYDFGRNFAGVPRLVIRGTSGSFCVIRYGELLWPNGTINVMTSVAGQVKSCDGGAGAPCIAYQVDKYTLSGSGANESWTPRFTWHGFRYAEFNCSGAPQVLSLEGLVLHQDINNALPVFQTSNSLLNQIQQTFRNSFISNSIGVVSDCPHRERFGYGGDGLGTAESALLNYDLATFYEKRVIDHHDAVRPNDGFTETAPYVGIATNGIGGGSGPIGWGTYQPQVAMYLYQYYGNLRIIEQAYPYTRRYIDLLLAHPNEVRNGLSDWLGLEPSPVAQTGVYFLLWNLRTAAKMATLLAKYDEADWYTTKANNVEISFNIEFLDERDGKYFEGSQCAQALPLYAGLTSEAGGLRARVLNVLLDNIAKHDNHLTVGLFGTKWLFMALAALGHNELAYAINTKTDFPSYGYMLSLDATTFWESWDYSNDSSSHNHHMMGSVSQWLISTIGGISIDPSAVAFDTILIAPRPVTGVTWSNVTHNSIRGPISVYWQITGGQFTAQVQVPANTITNVQLPVHCRYARQTRVVPELAATHGGHQWYAMRPLRHSDSITAATVDNCGTVLSDEDQSHGYVAYRITGGGTYVFTSQLYATATSASATTTIPNPPSSPAPVMVA